MQANKDIERKINEIMLHIGFPVEMSGFRYLKSLILHKLEKADPFIDMQQLYVIVAQEYYTNYDRVERNIRHLIEYSARNGLFKKYPELSTQDDLGNKSIISILSRLVDARLSNDKGDVEDTSIYSKMRTLLINTGLSRDYTGLEFLPTAVEIYSANQSINVTGKNGIYDVVAKKYGSTETRVERSIRKFIEILYDRKILDKFSEFRIQRRCPSNKHAIATFAEIVSKQPENVSSKTPFNDLLIKDLINSEESLKRAAWTKLLLRVDDKGHLCAPWSKETREKLKNTKLVYARPFDLKTNLMNQGKWVAQSSRVESQLVPFATIQTYHEFSERAPQLFNVSLEGIIKQIPKRISTIVNGIELVDYDNIPSITCLSENNIKRLVGVRLYTAKEYNDIPEKIVNQPIIYQGHRVSPENIQGFINSLSESEQ